MWASTPKTCSSKFVEYKHSRLNISVMERGWFFQQRIFLHSSSLFSGAAETEGEIKWYTCRHVAAEWLIIRYISVLDVVNITGVMCHRPAVQQHTDWLLEAARIENKKCSLKKETRRFAVYVTQVVFAVCSVIRM